MRRALIGAAIAALVIAVGAPSTAAAPAVDPPPPDGAPRGPIAPLAPTVQKTQCHTLTTMPGTDYTRADHALRTLRYDQAWRFTRGEGQRVAVIDTGVTPHPRLGEVIPGGDYVSSGDGRDDCDAHGTAVAGIIAARPSAGDSFAGVAPGASIIAIRQASQAFEPRDKGVNSHGNMTTMAYAVTRAVDLGATVINISEVACGAFGANLGDDALARAVKFAYDRNVVVVAAAGNVGTDGACSAQNEVPGKPVTVASPARFADVVLTVAATEPDGRAASFSLAGPWVALAAPGTDVTTLEPRGGGLVNGQTTRQGTSALAGTSFAAPYVAGVAALVRARYPQLTAAQVRSRILTTARAAAAIPAGALGAGIVDPVAALSADLPDGATRTGMIDLPPAPPRDDRPRTTALAGAGLLAVAAAAFCLSRRTRRS
ncbi:Peptidase S8 and S53 subtilisin kexin sedolisin OS=Tsukamurella paurometabola (strain ATCC 8368 /DSM / CCUG 35730 / CIP 100753 / JCM 10117 / KCTC 9821/ NBRC 16120 / NCIMB 702349 / NCTC 13040) OX=521096 GN=Tpau_0863 PE=3 SV=1 [Tsukamurella paurometabola]|uniref:Peptidase S8 and S53 subtilisin kexin sedolisin n=1 Tax=Tsukamurella paurometabola (strain ATCC 8368 / DSM 20162 / CCUG 35730 / CIP 100753 / JCM 10117 / KCTC 9821 / NBRC 16120 / NCIMB 702349 / NCTC 13040) TaxID=521096 RepID=D5UUC7_TSUPD|nr:type VII secretion-associated serine protease mycosin [Tsukamurella paurometabola]ADG77498.1 peptidase S8 and S53 subtilisin kexin sedolisin [Tsukamurella paurometabola DSM 20162]SUP27418.1 Thermophilic serine proteinase precursor [Tsukamurella paurometabola]